MIQLFATQLGFAVTGEPSGFAALGVDPYAIVAQGVTFVVLFVVIKKFALEKIVIALQKRRQTIEDSLKVAAELEQKQAELEQRVAQLLKEARSEADEILRAAREVAAAHAKTTESRAKQRVEDMLAENKLRITHEIAQAKRELKGEVAYLVSDATSAILRDSSSPAHERKLIEMYLKEVL